MLIPIIDVKIQYWLYVESEPYQHTTTVKYIIVQ